MNTWFLFLLLVMGNLAVIFCCQLPLVLVCSLCGISAVSALGGWFLYKQERKRIRKGQENFEYLEKLLHTSKRGEDIRQTEKHFSVGEGTEGVESERWRSMEKSLLDIQTAGENSMSGICLLMRVVRGWKENMVLLKSESASCQRKMLIRGICLVMAGCFFWGVLFPGWGPFGDMHKAGVVLALLILTATLGTNLVVLWISNRAWQEEAEGALSWEEELLFWMFRVMLHTEKGSVFYAIKKSDFQAGSQRLCREVEQLLEGIYDNPASIEPFENFCRGDNLPELREFMYGLYSMGFCGGEQMTEQWENFVRENKKKKREKTKKRFARMGVWGRVGGVVFSCLGMVFLLGTGCAFYRQNRAYNDAKLYYENARRQIEDSDFAAETVQRCVEQAKQRGYQMQVKYYGELRKDARITLYYTYAVPLLGNSEKYTVDGYAR